MAESVAVTCPECDKKMNVRPDIIGKKIRCKGCDEVFLARAPAGKAAVRAKAVPKPKKTAEAAAIVPFKQEEEEEEQSYGLTETDDSARCPECANEMESPEAIICLTCGYNTQTRLRAQTRRVHETTGLDWFLWLAPGIACVLGIIGMTTFDIIYCNYVDDWVEGSDWMWIFATLFVKMWGSIILVFIMFFMARFAVQRLVLNPIPPEIEKKK